MKILVRFTFKFNLKVTLIFLCHLNYLLTVFLDTLPRHFRFLQKLLVYIIYLFLG